jgi:predicted GNAT family acetyltransferase
VTSKTKEEFAMSDMVVSCEDGPTGGRCLTTIEGHTAGMTCSKAGAARLIIDHTGVSDALRGNGARQTPVKCTAEDARHAGDKTIPLCPFAKARIEKHPEWHDVLA